MEIRHLRAAVILAEELHFGRAAARLHMSQPPLSQQIRQIERELGVELFRRTKRVVRLTNAGRAFVAEARKALLHAEQAALVAQRAARGEIGRLRLGFVGTAAHAILPAVLGEYRARYPDVELVLRELTTAEQMKALQDRQLDVGIVRPPARGAGLAVQTFASEPFLAALPAAHPLAGASEVALTQLRDEPFVLFPRHLGSGFYDQIVGMCREAGFMPYVLQEAIQMQTIVGLVAAGIGVAIVPACMRDMPLAGVTYRSLTGVKERAEWALARAIAAEESVAEGFIRVACEIAAGIAPPSEN